MAFYMIGERINGMFNDIGEAVAKFDPNQSRIGQKAG